MKTPGQFFLKRDNVKLGILLGLISPLIVFILLYFIRFSNYPFDDFFEVFTREDRLITFFGVWCLVANIALFTIYTNTSRHQTAKGVFIITVVYGIILLLFKVIN
ncbi:MAG: hypothetical protein M3413_12645 [Bacteroidota bacterium]|nr:hypothetical protein [Bacteroidota bacterium]